MTDEQWLWVYVNMAIDDDENKEHMCNRCIEESASNDTCIRCGKTLHKDSFTNHNIDVDKFNRMSEEDSGIVTNKNFKADRFDRLNGGD